MFSIRASSAVVEFVDLADDCRHGVELGPLRRAPAPFTGDDLKAVVMRPQQDRLQHPALANRLGELVEQVLVELHPRLVGVRVDPRDIDLADSAPAIPRLYPGGRWGPPGVAEQRLEAHSEALRGPVRAHAASAGCGSLPMSSRARRT